MIAMDMRTVLCGFVIINFVNSLVITQLYFQNRKRYSGTGLWVASYILQVVNILAIVLRNRIPDWVSIDLSNTVGIVGMLLILMGLEKFTERVGTQIHNYILIVLFSLIHIWYTFFQPDLGMRTFNVSFAVSLFSFQCAWLIFVRASKAMQKISREVGIVFALLLIINLIRAIDAIINGNPANDFFKTDAFDVLMVISYQTLLILLTYSLVLMCNKRLQVGLLVQEEKFTKAFHSFPYANVISKMDDGRMIEANKGFLKMTGYSLSEVIGKTVKDIKLWVNYEDRKVMISNLMNSGRILEEQYLMQDRNGKAMIILISAEIITLRGEQCLIATLNDVTERMKIQNALAESENRLKELNATKDKFFSIIAHDLKDPFSSIIGISSLLKDQRNEMSSKEIEECIENINISSQRAMNLLLNLLDWSRSQTGKMDFKPDYVDISVITDTVLNLFQEKAKNKSITVSKNIPENTIIYADESMIATVLRNLISNAIKFTNQNGDVIVYSRKIPGEVIISVSDDGVGIPDVKIPKLFKLGENNISTKGTNCETGTGLGLILCREFVEKHSGKIWVESEPGKGSIFNFSIPLEA